MYFLKNSFFLLFTLCFCFTNAQNKKSDSLLLIIKNAQQDTTRYTALMNLGKIYGKINPDSALAIHIKARSLAEKMQDNIRTADATLSIGSDNYLKGNYKEALAFYSLADPLIDKAAANANNPKDILQTKRLKALYLGNTGLVYSDQGDFSIALDYYLKALKIDTEIENKDGVAAQFENIGIVYMNQGNFPKALDYFFKCLKIDEAAGSEKGIASDRSNIGIVYASMGDNEKALENFFKVLNINQRAGNRKGEATNLSNIGNVYMNQGNYDKALDYGFRSLKINEEVGYRMAQASSLLSIGSIYYYKKEYEKTLEYFLKAKEIDDEMGNKQSQAIDAGNIGSVYMILKKYMLAEKFIKEEYKLAKETGALNQLQESHQNLSTLYEQTNRSAMALEQYKLFIQCRDSIFNEQNTKASMQQEIKFNYEKKAAADSVKSSIENKMVASQLLQEKNQRYSLYAGLILVIIFASFMVNRFKVSQKQKSIIELKEKETAHQKSQLEEKQKEILDSITYAQRIQQALLAGDALLNKHLPEYFVLFKPKDIVSGDFYWATAASEKFYLAICDSTGHGVPGAFMSLLNISFLNESITEKKIINPNHILDHTRARLIQSLKTDGSEDGGKDGMDCILLAFDFSNNNLHYSAANNNFYIIRDNQLIVYPADKMPVGKSPQDIIPFSLQSIKLQKGDIIYALTDGYADQFGGINGKKYKYKQLKELLLANCHFSMKEQQKLITASFDNWKGNQEQVDDVLLIGIRIS